MTDKEWQIAKLLGLTVKEIPLITAGLEAVAAMGSQAVAELDQHIIDTEALLVQLKKEAGSTSFGLKGVDVISYDTKLRVAGMTALIASGLKRLGLLLGVEPSFEFLGTLASVSGAGRAPRRLTKTRGQG